MATKPLKSATVLNERFGGQPWGAINSLKRTPEDGRKLN
jgi:hypothetical protein